MSSSSLSKPMLLDQVRIVLRVKHSSLRTEQAYLNWIRRFIHFHKKRHPREMGEAEIRDFISDLAVNGRVSASTQTVALSALLFLKRVWSLESGVWSLESGVRQRESL